MQYNWIGSRKLEDALDIRKSQRASLRRELPEGLYWTQIGRKIFWNQELIYDWFLNGGDRHHPKHRRLVEEFLASLP